MINCWFPTDLHLDQNSRDGGDFELMIYHRTNNPSLCKEPLAIDYRSRNSFYFEFFSCFVF